MLRASILCACLFVCLYVVMCVAKGRNDYIYIYGWVSLILQSSYHISEQAAALRLIKYVLIQKIIIICVRTDNKVRNRMKLK